MRNQVKKIALALGVIATSATFLTACNTVKGTVEGAGQDIQAVGTAVTPKKPCCHHRRHYVRKTTTQMHNANGTTTTATTTTTTGQNQSSY